MRERPGKCRWCGCTYYEPCPESCGWANAEQTLCTACVNVDREWRKLKTKLPNMHRAFFRGYMAGSGDERAIDGSADGTPAIATMNPYASAGRRWWECGRVAGAKEAR